ncbi:hypothetical protein WMF30_56430 [Sorangium sp. So ce134]
MISNNGFFIGRMDSRRPAAFLLVVTPIVSLLLFIAIAIGAPATAHAASARDECWAINNSNDDFSYRCEFSLFPVYGPNAGVIKDGIFWIATNHFSDYFPFPGCGDVLEVGQTCNLLDIDLGYFDVEAPIEVTDITSNEFYFLSLDGHPEGAGRVIKFAIYVIDNDLRLGVRAWGPNTTAARLTVESGAATAIWGQYAWNLAGIISP